MSVCSVSNSNNANADSSNDEANSDGEDEAKTENVAPSRQSQRNNDMVYFEYTYQTLNY